MVIEISIIISKIKETEELHIQIKEKGRIATRIRCCQYCAETSRAPQAEDPSRDQLHQTTAEEAESTTTMDLASRKPVEETQSKETAILA